jgi:hypothetical protein
VLSSESEIEASASYPPASHPVLLSESNWLELEIFHFGPEIKKVEGEKYFTAVVIRESKIETFLYSFFFVFECEM